jgi:hypothetical protein
LATASTPGCAPGNAGSAFGAEGIAAAEVLVDGLTLLVAFHGLREHTPLHEVICCVAFAGMDSECSKIVGVIARALASSTNSIGIQNDEYFARLTKRIAIHFAEIGKGAGLTGGVMREDAFVDMLVSACPTRVSRKKDSGTVPDADYYIDGIPVSHKSISSRGGSDLALSWSKNPPGAPARNFESHMALMFVPSSGKVPKNSKSPWYSRPTGLYVIGVVELESLRKNGKLKVNNKSDYIVPKGEIARLMADAITHGHFVGIKSTGASVMHGRISLWNLVAPELKG